jgi:cellulose biosynthesis protein BcsQ
MFAELGVGAVAVDLDPQANLTSAFLDDDRLEELWSDESSENNIHRCVQPLIEGTGDVADPHLEHVADYLSLVVGSLDLFRFEDHLSEVWPKCMDKDPRAFRVTSAFWRIMQRAAEIAEADVVLMDLGPNLGAINRAALISADYVVVPVAPDLFSLQGLRNLGPALNQWNSQWADRTTKNPVPGLSLPPGPIKPIGYIVMQHSERLSRPTKAYEKWAARIPSLYRSEVLGQSTPPEGIEMEGDENCLAMLKHYRSLMPLAQEARKPIFRLKAADGVVGAHAQTVQDAYGHFRTLACEIAKRTGIPIPIS